MDDIEILEINSPGHWLLTVVNGKIHWRVWREGSTKTLEDKREELKRDVEWFKTHPS